MQFTDEFLKKYSGFYVTRWATGITYWDQITLVGRRWYILDKTYYYKGEYNGEEGTRLYNVPSSEYYATIKILTDHFDHRESLMRFTDEYLNKFVGYTEHNFKDYYGDQCYRLTLVNKKWYLPNAEFDFKSEAGGNPPQRYINAEEYLKNHYENKAS